MSEAMITGYQIYHGFLAGYRNIARHREHINRINVFPVPDGDTGTNMTRTIKAIVERMECHRSAGRILESIAYHSLGGARGNSGIILAQYLNGLAEKVGNQNAVTPAAFGRLVVDSVDHAYRAMENPQEGTILTVIREWAETAYSESLARVPIHQMFTSAYDAARAALKKTPEQLKVLKENKVVDAGAWGFVSFIEGIQRFLRDGPLPFSQRRAAGAGEEAPSGHHEHFPSGAFRELEYRYCTEMLIENPSCTPEQLKNSLTVFGDSLIVSRGKNRVRVHIHTNNPSRIVRIGRDCGSVVEQKADDMVMQELVVNRDTGNVAVLTDSIADIPRELLDSLRIHVISQKLIWDDEEFLDRLTLSPEDFYRLQSEKNTFPGSAAPERSRVDDIYSFLMEHHEHLIVLPVARALSGTWQQMVNAAEKYNTGGRRIEVIDTCLNSAAQGLLVVEIARMAAEGKPLGDLKEAAERLKRRIRIFVSVSTFKFMVKGGRVSPLKGFLANLMNLKPIISLDEDGRGIAFDKSFSAKGLLRKIAGLLKVLKDSQGIEGYAVVHAAAPGRAAVFAALAEEIIGFPPSYITDISPIVGMHSGNGAVAIGVIGRESPAD